MIKYLCHWKIRAAVGSSVKVEYVSGKIKETSLREAHRNSCGYLFRFAGDSYVPSDQIVYMKHWLDAFPAICSGHSAIVRYCLAPWKLFEAWWRGEVSRGKSQRVCLRASIEEG